VLLRIQDLLPRRDVVSESFEFIASLVSIVLIVARF